MKTRSALLLLTALLVAPLLIPAEVVTATSDPFTFPLIDNIRQKKVPAGAYAFTSHGYSARHRSLTLSWSVAHSVEAEKGVITIFTLQGKTLKTFSLDQKAGSVTWKIPGSASSSGVLIARLTYGALSTNLKIVMYR
ncbi:MAG: hypothetical protein JXA71_03110 [Chitinispirillaceae bacterium]|nr:hypothetical protein [Chitinispirillaceae bacterium]